MACGWSFVYYMQRDTEPHTWLDELEDLKGDSRNFVTRTGTTSAHCTKLKPPTPPLTLTLTLTLTLILTQTSTWLRSISAS